MFYLVFSIFLYSNYSNLLARGFSFSGIDEVGVIQFSEGGVLEFTEVFEIGVLISTSLGKLNDVFFFFNLENSDTDSNNALNTFFVS